MQIHIRIKSTVEWYLYGTFMYLEREVERDLEPEEERERDLELREEEEEELLLPDEERENLPRRFFFLPRGDFCRASSFSYTCGNQPINQVSFLSLKQQTRNYS
jgi:hypothetical protein